MLLTYPHVVRRRSRFRARTVLVIGGVLLVACSNATTWTFFGSGAPIAITLHGASCTPSTPYSGQWGHYSASVGVDLQADSDYANSITTKADIGLNSFYGGATAAATWSSADFGYEAQNANQPSGAVTIMVKTPAGNGDSGTIAADSQGSSMGADTYFACYSASWSSGPPPPGTNTNETFGADQIVQLTATPTWNGSNGQLDYTLLGSSVPQASVVFSFAGNYTAGSTTETFITVIPDTAEAP